MKLTVWTYEGPPHRGGHAYRDRHEGRALRASCTQGDTYADLLFTMIERRDHRPPVTYTTFQARDLGGDTAELFKTTLREAYDRFKPQAMIVGASCTAELIQDDPGGLANSTGLPIPVLPLDLPSYQKKENWGAAETFYQLVRALAPKSGAMRPPRADGGRPLCNILGPTALGFRHRDDLIEITRLLDRLGVSVNVTAPLGASPDDLKRLPDADFNIVLYPEIAEFGGSLAGTRPRSTGGPHDPDRRRRDPGLHPGGRRCRRCRPWPCPGRVRLGGCLGGPGPGPPLTSTGKRVFIFGDATHAIAAARVASEELGFEVVGLGAHTGEFARDVRAAAENTASRPSSPTTIWKSNAPSPSSNLSWFWEARWSVI